MKLYWKLGTTDENTTCDFCGRVHLKKTVVMQDDGGAIRYGGVVCAAKALGWGDKQVERECNNAMIDEAHRMIVSTIKSIRSQFISKRDYGYGRVQCYWNNSTTMYNRYKKIMARIVWATDYRDMAVTCRQIGRLLRDSIA